MKSYPILHLADPLDPGADLMLFGMIDPADLDAFRGEVAHELAALLGVNREAVVGLVTIEPRDAQGLPVPSEFTLSDRSRRLMAADVARALRFALGASSAAA